MRANAERTAKEGAGTATRERILEAAEALFASEGVDRATLRQIARASNQENVAAVQYHFGGKEGLLDEILDRSTRSTNNVRDFLRTRSGTPEPSCGRA